MRLRAALPCARQPTKSSFENKGDQRLAPRRRALLVPRACSQQGSRGWVSPRYPPAPRHTRTPPPQLRPRPSLPARSTGHLPGAPPPLAPIDARPPPLDGPWAWREPPRHRAPVGGGEERKGRRAATFTARPRGGVRWHRGYSLAAAYPISGAAPPCAAGRDAGPDRRVRRLPPVDRGCLSYTATSPPRPSRRRPGRPPPGASRVATAGRRRGAEEGVVLASPPLVVLPPLAGQRLAALRQPTACGGRHRLAARRLPVRKERGATVRRQGVESSWSWLSAGTHSPTIGRDGGYFFMRRANGGGHGDTHDHQQ